MMKTNKILKAKCILAVYLIATVALLLVGYNVRKPAVMQQEFPFTITYSFQGKTETISDFYVGEYAPKAKYLGDDSVSWYGYIKDHDRLQWDYYRIAEVDGQLYSINLNMEPGYLMGDPAYAGFVCQPSGAYNYFDGTNDIVITDPAELEKRGFSIISWEYPQPIENSFSFGGISLSSEATIYTTVLAAVALLACMVLIKKDREIASSKMDKVAAVFNFLVAIVACPFIFVVSALSEILADTSVWQQILYLAPALTILGIATSVVLRRCRLGKHGMFVQFAGPIVFAAAVLIEQI